MNKSGFTLVEVLIATALLLIILSATVQFFLTGLNATQRMERSNTALNLARSTLEGIIQQDFSAIESKSNQDVYNARQEVEPNYQGQVVVTDIDVGLRRVAVTVEGVAATPAKGISETLSTAVAE